MQFRGHSRHDATLQGRLQGSFVRNKEDCGLTKHLHMPPPTSIGSHKTPPPASTDLNRVSLNTSTDLHLPQPSTFGLKYYSNSLK